MRGAVLVGELPACLIVEPRNNTVAGQVLRAVRQLLMPRQLPLLPADLPLTVAVSRAAPNHPIRHGR
jgi:hypothetical protein